jgi:hypothetical protein
VLPIGVGLYQLRNPLVGEPQHAAGIAHRHMSLRDQVARDFGAGSRSLTLQDFSFFSYLAHPTDPLFEVSGQPGFDPNIK